MADAGEIKAKLTLDLTNFNANMAKAKNDMDKTSKSSQKLKSDLTTMRTGFMAVGTAAVAGIGYAVYHAANFEHAMARVKALTSATDTEFSALSGTARDLGAATEFSATQAAEGMQYLAMAGFDVNEIISAMPNVLNLASAAQVDMATSADIVSNIMTGFGMTAAETDRAVDVLVDTMRSANTDLNMLADGMKYVAPVAHGLGWSIEETAAAIGAMSDAGVQGSMAGTSLRAALLSLASPTGRAKKAMEQFNIEVMDSNGNLKPMPELVSHISERLGGLTKAQRTAALSHLVGREAAAGFIAMIERGGPSLQAFTEQLENSAGVAEEVATTQRDTLMGSLKELESAFEELGIAVGNQFIPVLRAVVEGVTELGRFMSELDPKLVAGAAAFIGAGAAAGTFASSIGILMIGLRGLGPLLGPAGWLITGISVLAGLFGAAAISQGDMTESTARQTREMYEQNKAAADMIDRFEILRDRANLTNAEFAEFIDIQTQLLDKSGLTKAEVAVLTNRLKELQSKSSLTKDEWEELYDLNGKLTETYPDHGNALSDLGNKYVENVKAIREMNAAQRESLRLDLYNKLNESLVDYNENQREAKRLQKEYRDGVARTTELTRERIEVQERIEQIEQEIADASEARNSAEARRLATEKTRLIAKLDALGKEIKSQSKLNRETEKEMQNRQKNVEKARETAQQLADVLLAQNNINISAGKNLENIHKRIFAIEDELALYEQKVQKGEKISSAERDYYQSILNEKGVLEDILSQVGARELFEEKVRKKLREQYEEAKKTSKELNGKSEREHSDKPVKDELKTAKDTTKELDKVKSSRQHNFASVKEENKTAKDTTKENNKKTHRPHDSSEVKKGLDLAKDTTKETGKKSKKQQDNSDLRAGLNVAKDTTREANKKSKKPLDYSSILNALVNAKSLHNWLTAPARKVVSVARNIYEKVVNRHQGGLVPDVPKFHSGGIADFSHGMGGITPGLGGVDARLLGREMVLTQFQQARLFNAINSGTIGSGGMTRQDFEEIADRIANRPVYTSVQIDKREVARAIAEPVKEEHVRMAKQNLRWRGGRNI